MIADKNVFLTPKRSANHPLKGIQAASRQYTKPPLRYGYVMDLHLNGVPLQEWQYLQLLYLMPA